MFSIMNNLSVLCFVQFLDHTEPIQSEAEQNPVIFTCIILPRLYPYVFHLLLTVPDPIVRLNLGHHHFGDVCCTSLRVLVLLHKHQLHENARRSCTQSVFLARIGRVFEHAALRHLLLSGSEYAS